MDGDYSAVHARNIYSPCPGKRFHARSAPIRSGRGNWRRWFRVFTRASKYFCKLTILYWKRYWLFYPSVHSSSPDNAMESGRKRNSVKMQPRKSLVESLFLKTSLGAGEVSPAVPPSRWACTVILAVGYLCINALYLCINFHRKKQLLSWRTNLRSVSQR